MLKNILAAIVGVLAGGVVVMFAEMVGHLVFPLPFEIDVTDIESMKNSLELNADLIPIGAFLSTVLAHLLGTAAGVFIACKIAKSTLIPAYVVIGFMLVSTIMNFVQIPTPTWVMAADVVGVLLGGYLGLRAGSRRRPEPINPHRENR